LNDTYDNIVPPSGVASTARLHHIGFVLRDIRSEIDHFAYSLGGSWDGIITSDPYQKVKVAFLQTANKAEALIELVEPEGESSPVLHFLQRGGGLHHVCYEVVNIDFHLEQMRRRGAVVVRRPLPAPAFENRRVAWLLTKEKLLIEFLECEKI
jgi:methylmalonyl-CoA/ethylmalonyl-CoA epimerase